MITRRNTPILYEMNCIIFEPPKLGGWGSEQAFTRPFIMINYYPEEGSTAPVQTPNPLTQGAYIFSPEKHIIAIAMRPTVINTMPRP